MKLHALISLPSTTIQPNLPEVDRQRGSVEKEQDPKVQRNSCRGFQKKIAKIYNVCVPVSAVALCFVAFLLFVCLFE